MKVTIKFAADNAAILLTQAVAPRGKLTYDYLIQAGGNFGGGTLTFLISLDGGTTKNSLRDASGNAYSTITADTFSGSIPAKTNIGQEPIIYAALTGSTSPNLNIVLVDNR